HKAGLPLGNHGDRVDPAAVGPDGWGRVPLAENRAARSARGNRLVRVCVVGCGAVGSLFAASLAQLGDVEVWAFDLDRAHVDAIDAHGLRLVGAGEIVGAVHATTDATALPACDFGIVATKAMHTEAAISATA